MSTARQTDLGKAVVLSLTIPIKPGHFMGSSWPFLFLSSLSPLVFLPSFLLNGICHFYVELSEVGNVDCCCVRLQLVARKVYHSWTERLA